VEGVPSDSVRAVAGALNIDQKKGEASVGNRLSKIVNFENLEWTPLIKGCDLASVYGDANAEGAPFVLRLRCADGAKIPAHWHPADENITVLKGTLLVGMGENFDEAKLRAMNVGNFVSLPKEMRHFAMSKGETIVQIHGAGPFQANWVNPSEVQPPGAAPGAAAKPGW